MTELNNLPVSRLPDVLREDTLMEGYFGLIEHASIYCARLHEAGVLLLFNRFKLMRLGRLEGIDLCQHAHALTEGDTYI